MRLGVWIKLGFAVTVLAAVLVNSAAYAAVTRYESSIQLPEGTLVALNSQKNLERASFAQTNYIGVAQGGGSAGFVDVAHDGEAKVLVTDQFNTSGDFNKGAKIGVSLVDGIAGSWEEGGGQLVGVLLEAPRSWSILTIDSRQSIRVALVSVQLQPASPVSQDSLFGGALALVGDVAATLVGKQVAIWRVITALVISGGGMVLGLTLLITTSRQSFLSIGRNPLAKTMIMRELWKMVGVSATIIIGAFAAAYAVLVVG